MPSTDKLPRPAEATSRPVADVAEASGTRPTASPNIATAAGTGSEAARAVTEVDAEAAARRDLVARAREREQRQTDRATTRRNTWSGLEGSYAMSLELMAALATWAGIGWLLDRWLGTGPWFLAIGALLGNAAGIYLIYVRSSRMEGYDGLEQPSAFAARHGARDAAGSGGRP